MKIFVLSPDAQGQVDPTIQKNLIDFIPDRVASEHEADAVLIPISWFPNFEFKQPHINKPWVLLDYMEPHCTLAAYDQFEQWIKDNLPILRFTRELRESDRSPVNVPCEFPCYLDIPEPQDRLQFDSRPLEALYFWGFSNALRPKLHAKIFEAMNSGIDVISHWEQWNENLPPNPRRWATIHTPHWSRKHINEVKDWMLRSKVTVAMPGNGVKTFRHAETVGTLMALPYDDLAWSYPWINEENCIRLTPNFEFATLEDAIRTCDLYPMYLAGQENLRKYQSFAYVRDWILSNIGRVL